MLGRFEFLLALLVPMIFEGMAIVLARRKNAKKLPWGSRLVRTYKTGDR